MAKAASKNTESKAVIKPMTEQERETLLSHLQTAIEIELSTIPIYLYTYYSIIRVPENLPGNDKRWEDVATFANKAGALIMSVAVEEMLHMSLACNIMRALGGTPKLYCMSPGKYPTNLPHHKKGFAVGLCPLSADQMTQFLVIEKPEANDAPPQGDNWDTIGQFYDYLKQFIITKTTDADFRPTKKDPDSVKSQLADGRGYYSANNVDTIYPKDAFYLQQPINPYNPVERGSVQAQYPNNKDSGDLKTVKDKASALAAIEIITHQGEGYPDTDHKEDDYQKDEETHWYKYNELYKKLLVLTPEEMSYIVFKSPDNPTRNSYPSKFFPIVDLANAVYSYLFLMTETSYMLTDEAQASMFYIGMHKGMIFILDKIIGGMRYLQIGNTAGQALAPTFENYQFNSLATAKEELVALCVSVPASLNLDPNILGRIQDLPDVNVGPDKFVHFN